MLKKQWFLLSLAAMLAAGFLFPGSFQGLADSTALRNGIVATVLFLMALPLETRVVIRTVRRPWAALLASVINMGLLPLMAWAASGILPGDLAIGVIIASAAPCTLASAAVWTRRAGGNDATALLVTLLTNSTCFIITPLWLSIMTRTETALDVREMMTKLCLLVVAPMTLAQLCRLSPQVARAATSAKHGFGVFAQAGILCMVLIGAVKCSTYLATSDWRQVVSVADLTTMVVVVVSLHLAALWLGYGIAGGLRIERPDQLAVAISGSQKTFMIGLYVAVNYFGGLAILPMVAYHVGQLFLDTLIADHWARNE